MHSKNLRVKQFVVHARFEVIADVATKTVVFLAVMPSRLTETCRRFGEIYRPLLYSRKAFVSVKDGSTKLIQKSVNFNETTRRHIPYDGSLRTTGGFR